MSDRSHHRPLTRIVFTDRPKPGRVDGASRPALVWVEPEKLAVDTRYQRDIGKRGAANIRRMIEDFDWSRFGVITAVALPDSEAARYAIIDGQHRATAALMHPSVVKVPCWVIEADAAAQARTFMGINAAVTAISPMQLYHAGVAAGIADAAGAEACAAAAGVTVMRYPVPAGKLKAGQTLAAGTLRQMWKQHGAGVLGPALAVLALADSDGTGLVNVHTIKALCEVLAARHLSDALAARLQSLDLEKREDAARLASLREGGSVAAHLAAAISAELDEAGFARKAAAPARRARRGLGSY
ncbi:hypothetical protein [Hoeflea sp.]|uniref:hypothetical protein n=1 Tax=Hoeflea sp. TaxID=1940281 RepID=UPI0019BE2BC8|nr:hypothetical protein [Hoeflea sp.]MBC7282651.1 ParB N-terminal domain-containing protein [Hoeflea sp.]